MTKSKASDLLVRRLRARESNEFLEYREKKTWMSWSHYATRRSNSS